MNLAECVTKKKIFFCVQFYFIALHHKYSAFRSVIIGILTKKKCYGFFIAAIQLMIPDKMDKKYLQIFLNLSIL